MKPLTLMLIIAGLATSACLAEDPKPSASEVYGSWKVVKINTTGAVTESEQRMNALVGSTLTITKDEVLEAGERPCAVVTPYPVASIVDTAKEVPVKAAPSPAAAGLPAKALMVDTGCLAVFKVGNNIVFGDRGAYYTAERMPDNH